MWLSAGVSMQDHTCFRSDAARGSWGRHLANTHRNFPKTLGFPPVNHRPRCIATAHHKPHDDHMHKPMTAVDRLDAYARMPTTEAGLEVLRRHAGSGPASVPFDDPKPGSHPEYSVHLHPGDGIRVACGVRLRQLGDPTSGPDGKPLRKPVVGFTYRAALVSCPACRAAQDIGAWDGRLVP